MAEVNKKPRKPIWVNFAVLALLLVIGGFTLTACQQPNSGREATEDQEEKQPAQSNQDEDEDEDKGKGEGKGEDTQEDDDPE